ncbi:MAG: DUF3006 domain-containing protein [Syntrophomonadaceae bacterium]
MFAVIDRFEGSYAVCETDGKEMVNIARSKVPPEAKEGDVLLLGDIIRVDFDETERRKKEIQELIKDLWE